MNQLKNTPNSQAALYNMLSSDPKYKSFLSLMKMNSGDWQQAAQMMAEQCGVDLNNLIRELQS